MRSGNYLKFLVRSCAKWILLATASAAPAGGPHYVFAHYMVCYALYGDTVAGYQQEIKDAQAAGIDGFAMDVGEWNGPDTYYKTRVESIYEAAEGLNSGFKLFFSVDMASTNDIVQMISAYAGRSNSFYYKGGLVVSSFCGNGLDWTNGVYQPLQTRGVSNIFFIPFFTPEGYSFDNTMAGVSALLAKYSFLDGLFNFGAGLPGDISFVNNAYYQACTNAGKLFMAGVSPSYWGYAQYSTGRTYFESQGGEGMAGEWNWVIQNQPDWVELVTWNDLTESTYINPLVQPDWNTYLYNTGPCRRFSHNGYLELSKRYINWYKTGQPPATNQDVLFYFYRTHFTNEVAAATNEIPVSVFMGNVQDVIYTTTLLTAPADLEIVSGTNYTTNSLPPGLSNLRTPFAAGAQQFTLRRNGTPLLTVQGSNIAAQIQYYDYFTSSGYAYGSNAMAPPTHLRVIGN